jgi:uncharacterized protein (DUF2249 family)
MITAETNLGVLLDEHPQLVELLASRHDHFARLRNRMLRRLMAPRVTVAQAASIAGLPADALVAEIRRAIGEPAGPAEVPPGSAAIAAAPRPSELDGRRVVEVDVRDDIRRGDEPFAQIMAAVKGLAGADALMIRVPFEPVPLYDVLGRRGLAHWTERVADDDWRIWFHRAAASQPPAPMAPDAVGGSMIDVRGLEPPLPMVRVLERLDALEPGGALTVLHERRPMFLYPQLDARGFHHETDEPEPGLVRIIIRRAVA